MIAKITFPIIERKVIFMLNPIEYEYMYEYMFEDGTFMYGAMIFHSKEKIKEFISDQFPGEWSDDMTYKVDCSYGPEKKYVIRIRELRSV